MGNCFTTNVPKRVQFSEARLLGKNVKSTQLHQHNLTDSEQHEFQYREIEHSMTHNSNLNPMVPSNNSSPPHRPIKSNQMIYGNLNSLHHSSSVPHNNMNNNLNYARMNIDLQRQIDILKQCSNDEIKMLKARIQCLEKQFESIHLKQMISPIHGIDDEYKGHSSDRAIFAIKCTKDTPIKSCPKISRIIKISQIYNDHLQSKQEREEFKLWNVINHRKNASFFPQKYDLSSLISDYCHMLEIHCNHNNIFELRMVYLDIYELMNSKCIYEQCQCINHTMNEPFTPKLLYILSIIHCYLYHAYNAQQHQNSDDFLQRLRDHIMDKNDKLTEYHKTGQTSPDLHKVDLSQINIRINTTDNNMITAKNNEKKVYSQTPPVLLTQQSKQMIASIGDIPVDPTHNNLIPPEQTKCRHGSVNSVVSNISNNSASKSSQSVSNISSLSMNDNKFREDTDPDQVPKLLVSPITKSNHNKRKPTAIEMSEDRVRRLSGQVDADKLKELIDEYDNDERIDIEYADDDHGIIHPSSSDTEHDDDDDGVSDNDEDDDDDVSSSSLSEIDKAEVEEFKLKFDADRDSVDGRLVDNGHMHSGDDIEDKERRGSKHNLMRLQQGDEWDSESMAKTAEDMKKQLLHLALTSPIDQ